MGTSLIVLGGLGFIFAALLAFLNNKLKVDEDPDVARVLAVLPGINCGACGFSGCKAYAQKVVEERNIFNGCLPGGGVVNDKVSCIIGLDAGQNSDIRKIAVCKCMAGDINKRKSNNYSGPLTCSAANITAGAIDCVFGCIGYGDCVKACPVNAISVKDGRVNIDADKCLGCGICVKSCPRELFSIIERRAESVYVGCNNKDSALNVKKVCSAGCIGCGICQKMAPGAFKVENMLSCYDQSYKGDESKIEIAKSKCPTKCIYDIV
ncbi:MAG: (Fe-S)-binding protein [Candidatus Omnitrophica bacterium]|nr:(Fe-S)-binding protein [Candidatus Omnitrophota bacterium]